MSNFVLTLPLKTEKYQEDILNKNFEKCRKIYNSTLMKYHYYVQLVLDGSSPQKKIIEDVEVCSKDLKLNLE